MATNDKYSFKDFTCQDLSALDASEFNGQGDIVGSCFAQYYAHDDVIPVGGGKEIFPASMLGVTFTRCNLDNVSLPVGNTVDSTCTNKTIQEQNDREDWALTYSGGSWSPNRPIREQRFTEYGISTDPNNIPGTRQEQSPVEAARDGGGG